jgi:GH15 family glucan-1,4-alpha-glucosidase
MGHLEQAERWDRIAASERAILLDRGFNRQRGYFTQTLDGKDADASNLLLATLGLVEPRDPRFISTVERYSTELVDRGLMARYKNLDDFGETTSAFTICGFWFIEALAQIGQLDKAVEEFHRLSRYKNRLGLFSEDIDPATGALLGNFPQAYTHVGLINAATTISELLDARDGSVRAWS